MLTTELEVLKVPVRPSTKREFVLVEWSRTIATSKVTAKTYVFPQLNEIN